MQTRNTGIVKLFKNGWGFITRDDGIDYFVHWTEILMDGFKSLEKDQRVTFDIGNNSKGLCAINVKVIHDDKVVTGDFNNYANYTEDELIRAVQVEIAHNDELARDIARAVRQRQGGWLSNLIIGVAKILFGSVIGGVVEAVVGWFLNRR